MWTGLVGIGLAILVFVVLGNPSAGGAYPAQLLPPFWSAIGPWLPPGAATGAIRGIVYFGGAGAAIGRAGAGRLRARRRRRHDGRRRPAAAAEADGEETSP